MKKKEMFFLPAELMKEARNEVLSLWMETEHEARVQFRVSISFHAHEMIQVLFLAKPYNGYFPPYRPLLVQNKAKKKGRKKKKVWVRLTAVYQVQEDFFYFFLFLL